MIKNIIGLSKTEFDKTIIELGEKPFRANQIWNWIYVQGAKSFSEMTNISKITQEKLAENFHLNRPQAAKDLISQDGTRKWLAKFADDNQVEVVFIPEETRGTLCISSQIGCTLACKFCHTGTQTLVRNLETEEIVAQVLMAKDFLQDFNKQNKKITNIVFMGMGEPFFNYENVATAVKILNDISGLDIPMKRITLSTSGLVPEILRCATELKTNLAISLHATNDTLRTSIMAINKKYPLSELMKACQGYNSLNPSRKITFEYVMLKDINDHINHTDELVKLIKIFNLNAKINLIPFNSWMSCGYEGSEMSKIKEFQQLLKNAGLVVTIRKTRGQDVMAACGQLKSESERVKKVRI
jgi:23S rRNA (adenine2503-C2)-methyltransferase